tara:strand:- start:2679 stop:3059 length:381 start_codon:yes stop_codon:yes gene_type:complete
MGLGGILGGIGKGIGAVMNTVQPVVNAVAPIAANIPQLAPVVGAGKTIMNLTQTVLEATDEADAMETAEGIKTIVLDIMELPGGVADGGGESAPVVLPGKQNPANQFLQSRFGFLGEGSSILSNFF